MHPRKFWNAAVPRVTDGLKMGGFKLGSSSYIVLALSLGPAFDRVANGLTRYPPTCAYGERRSCCDLRKYPHSDPTGLTRSRIDSPDAGNHACWWSVISSVPLSQWWQSDVGFCELETADLRNIQ